MRALIDLRKVTKVYEPPGGARAEAPAVTALHSLSLSFARGEFTAIAGPSGSGKSTLLNIIGTLDSATGGEVVYDGRKVSGLSEAELADFRLRSLGFVFQAYNLIPVLTAVENVERVGPARPAQGRARAGHGRLEGRGLTPQAGRRPTCSGGQQRGRGAGHRACPDGRPGRRRPRPPDSKMPNTPRAHAGPEHQQASLSSATTPFSCARQAHREHPGRPPGRRQGQVTGAVLALLLSPRRRPGDAGSLKTLLLHLLAAPAPALGRRPGPGSRLRRP